MQCTRQLRHDSLTDLAVAVSTPDGERLQVVALSSSSPVARQKHRLPQWAHLTARLLRHTEQSCLSATGELGVICFSTRCRLSHLKAGGRSSEDRSEDMTKAASKRPARRCSVPLDYTSSILSSVPNSVKVLPSHLTAPPAPSNARIAVGHR